MRNIRLVLLFFTLAFIVGCNNPQEEVELKEEEELEEGVYDTHFLGEEERYLYYGDETAKQELLFVFDYSCSWCKKWMDEVFPTVNEEIIAPGIAKYRSQAMVFVNAASLKLANFDQSIKETHPEHYYEIQMELMNELADEEVANWGTDEYLIEKVQKFGIDSKVATSSPSNDVINLTRNYTRNLDVEYVPTLYVNGVKVEDAFNVEEIKSYLNQ